MADRYAEIIVGLNQPRVDRIFSYRIPETMQEQVVPGTVVEVPFGKGNRKERGFVLEVADRTDYDPEQVKEIRKVLSEQAVFTEEQLSFARWMQSYYDAPLGACLSLWVPRQATRKPRKKTEAEAPEVPASLPLPLNAEQARAAQAVSRCIHEKMHRVFLLHGITGSGKTEVYMHLIRETLEQGRQAILLVPEISLTPQLIDIFEKRFGAQVGVTHSRMTDAQRAALWRKARAGQIRIVIGPRSALFTPFENTGLLILDEEHETTYKSEQSPRYHARDAAIEMGRRKGIPVVLGSATPQVETYYKALHGEYTLLELKKRAVPGAGLPVSKIIDMREEMAEGNMSIFSRDLVRGLAERLQKGEQSILFLNRKGYSTFVSCRSCGFVLKCPRCYLPYTWHKDQNLLICHHCGKEVQPVTTCPECGSPYIRHFGTGTQRVEEELKGLFPQARVLRLDTSVIRGEETYRDIYEQFRDQEADILVGTQIVAKGFDFPHVTLVGVISADMVLYSEDYHSTERTYQLLTQVSGRAGRADIPGEVLIQTYSPEHYSIQDAARSDYLAFYQSELTARRLIGAPPFTHILQFLLTGENEEALERQTAQFHQMLVHYGAERGFRILGPSPASLERINNVFRRRILVKLEDRDRLMVYGRFCRNKYLDAHPRARIQMDIDPVFLI